MNRRTTHSKSPLAVAIGSLLAMGSVQAAVITVDTTDDGEVGSMPGMCTLRSAIASANENASYDGCASGSAGADEIVFDSSLEESVITLQEGEIIVKNPLTITGPVAGDPAGIVINGNNATRVFHVFNYGTDDLEVNLAHMTVTGASSTQSAGAVRTFNASLNLDHVLVTGNSTSLEDAGGAGLSIIQGDLQLTNSTVSGNSTAGIGARGGGLYVKSGNLTLINSTVSGNSTAGSFADGGGIAVQFGGATLISSTVFGNSTSGYLANGGGVVVRVGDTTLINSTVSGNSVTGNARGGGLYVSDVTVTHSTVAYNTATVGADGLHRPLTRLLTLNNSLIVQAGADETACYQAADFGTNSLATDASCTGTVTSLAEIALQPLADNGGPTLTHALDDDSVAHDAAGDCVETSEITTDQRGQQRPGVNTTACDIGAFEFQLIDEVFRDRFQLE